MLYRGANPESYLRQARPELWPMIPIGAKRILDIGCGGGSLGAYIKQRGQDVYYCGIDFDPERRLMRKRSLTKFT